MRGVDIALVLQPWVVRSNRSSGLVGHTLLSRRKLSINEPIILMGFYGSSSEMENWLFLCKEATRSVNWHTILSLNKINFNGIREN